MPTATRKPLVVVIAGPAGVGKTSLAEGIADKLKCPCLEGDTVHPKANIDKMAHGIPLTDDDRWGWLQDIATLSAAEATNSESKFAVVTCSSLKKKYRSFLLEKKPSDVDMLFAFLYAPEEELIRRAQARKGHYMKANMVHSQILDMEVPKGDELAENGGHCFPMLSDKPVSEIIEDLHEFIMKAE